jgi:hypothetical protein
MVTKEQMDALSNLIWRCDNQLQAAIRDSDPIHHGQRVASARHIMDLAMHVKQIQLEVSYLGQQLSDLGARTRG